MLSKSGEKTLRLKRRLKQMRMSSVSLVCKHYSLQKDIYVLLLARLQKDWRSRVYAFFRSEVDIVYVDDRKCHEFTCNAKHCKGKGKNARIVRRYLDTKDKASTKSLRAHAIKCWGQEIVKKSEEARNIASAREVLKGAELHDGSITA